VQAVVTGGQFSTAERRSLVPGEMTWPVAARRNNARLWKKMKSAQ
jgi:hypothetical protein